MAKECVVCEGEISRERLQLQPRAKTCKPECAAEHLKNLRRVNSRESKRRQREAAKQAKAAK